MIDENNCVRCCKSEIICSLINHDVSIIRDYDMDRSVTGTSSLMRNERSNICIKNILHNHVTMLQLV